MSREVTKPTTPKQASDAKDAASRLKADLVRDALGRMFGEDGEKQAVPGPPRVILALGNQAQTAGWDRAKVFQRQMFDAAAGSGLEMKFAFYDADNAAGVRRSGSRRVGSPTPTTWRPSWIGLDATVVATFMFATCSRKP